MNKSLSTIFLIFCSLGWISAAPIHEAVAKSDLSTIEMELQNGIDINLPIKKGLPQEGFTPLALAITEMNLDAMKMLLANGANVNDPIQYGEAEGYSPLILAASLQGLRPLQLLVDYGADVDRKNPFGHAKILLLYMLPHRKAY